MVSTSGVPLSLSRLTCSLWFRKKSVSECICRRSSMVALLWASYDYMTADFEVPLVRFTGEKEGTPATGMPSFPSTLNLGLSTLLPRPFHQLPALAEEVRVDDLAGVAAVGRRGGIH